MYEVASVLQFKWKFNLQFKIIEWLKAAYTNISKFNSLVGKSQKIENIIENCTTFFLFKEGTYHILSAYLPFNPFLDVLLNTRM